MLKEHLYELLHKRKQALDAASAALVKGDMETHKAKKMEVEKLNGEINDAKALLAEEGRFDDDEKGFVRLDAARKMQKEDEARQKSVDEIRGSNEYARAFAKAMKIHAHVKESAGVEGLRPLYKALTESGGTTPGEDGGFLVPVDFDNQIIRLSKEYLDLSTLFHVEPVSTLSGWRVIETGTPKALASLEEMGTIAASDQPKFTRVDYKVKKYGERLVISDELLDDNAANLLAYVADWFAPKYVLTKNTLLLPLLTALTKKVELPAGGEDAALRKALITQLNTAQSRGAVLLTNQSGYAEMDGWADANGRPLLVPNPADPQVLRYRARQVVYGDDTELANGADSIPLYVGDFQALGTLFVRKGIELATTNVGGNAWATDSTELRALCRLDAKAMDTTAAFVASISTKP